MTDPLTLVFVACLMAAPTDCRTVELQRPPGMSEHVCAMSAMPIIAQWMTRHGEGRFVRRWACRRGVGA